MLQCMDVSASVHTQWCLTLCNSKDCSIPGSSVLGILQARILEWVGHALLQGNLPNPGIQPTSPALQADSLQPSHWGSPQMWELDHKEGWGLKNCCFQIMGLEKTLESPLVCNIKPVNPKGNQLWVFIGTTIAEAETPVLWPPYVKSRLVGKDHDAGKDWR